MQFLTALLSIRFSLNYGLPEGKVKNNWLLCVHHCYRRRLDVRKYLITQKHTVIAATQGQALISRDRTTSSPSFTQPSHMQNLGDDRPVVDVDVEESLRHDIHFSINPESPLAGGTGELTAQAIL
jgi:hypothetical protein